MAGARGDRGNSAPEHVEVGWSSPIGSALTLCLRTEGSTVRDREFSTNPATRSHVTTQKVRISTKQVSKTNYSKLLTDSVLTCIKNIDFILIS